MARPVDESVQHTVQSVVDDVVEQAIRHASLNAEKARVQSLINNLVTQVQSKPNPAKPPLTVQAVAVGDHRLRKVANMPLVWTQTMDSLTLTIHVPESVRKEHIKILFSTNSIHIQVHSSDASKPYFDLNTQFAADIDPAGCLWGLERGVASRRLILEIEKSHIIWWNKLFASDQLSHYKLVDTNQVFLNDTAAKQNTDASTQKKSISLPSNLSSPSSSRSASSRAEISKPTTLKQTVSNVVDSIVDDIADCDDYSITPAPIQPKSRQKVLTRADLPKIVDQYRAAFKKGGKASAESALQLATFYHHGIGVKKDDAEAVRLYRYALENGCVDASAAFQLGLIYNQGAPGVESNSEQAVHWWTLSAGLGNPVAMFNLGVTYLNGSGCELDPIRAQHWFERAHALNPQLMPPQLSRVQFAERMAIATKQKRERLRKELPLEERERRKELALQKVKWGTYSIMALAGISVSMIALRHWWRNRL